jgi:hypothetical protein
MERTNGNYQFFKKSPFQLYYELRDYLSPKCYYELLTTSKLLDWIHRETRIVVLRDPAELDVILSRIQNPKTQLVIDITSQLQISEAAKRLTEVPSYKIRLWNGLHCNWAKVTECHSVVYGAFSLEAADFSSTSVNVKELRLGCSPRCADLSPFSHLSKLSVCSLRGITNARCLGNLSSLELVCCSDFSDLAGLGKIPKSLVRILSCYYQSHSFNSEYKTHHSKMSQHRS